MLKVQSPFAENLNIHHTNTRQLAYSIPMYDMHMRENIATFLSKWVQNTF